MKVGDIGLLETEMRRIVTDEDVGKHVHVYAKMRKE